MPRKINLNLNDSLIKALKMVNSSTKNTEVLTDEDLKKHRQTLERAYVVAAPPITVDVEVTEINGLGAEWVRPDFPHDKKNIILYCHGGGYISGGLGYARILATKLANRAGLEVLAFDYHLAPEHPYPTAINDALGVWDYLMYQGYGASDIYIAGDSAGGNLALELVLALRDAGRMLPKAVVLFSPWTDMTNSSDTFLTMGEKDPILSANYIRLCRNAYLGSSFDAGDPDQLTDVRISPLYADFTGFPPTLIQVGSEELLLDDSRSLRKKMAKDGVNVSLHKYNDMWHVFQQMPLPKAGEAMAEAGEFIRSFL